MAKTYKIAVIPGDGIGKEVTPWAQKALEKAAEGVADFEYENFDLGAERYLRDGAILPEDEEERIKANDAILLGAVGDPRIKAGILERGLLLKLRFDLDQYVNLRPSKLYKGVTSPLANPGDIAGSFLAVQGIITVGDIQAFIQYVKNFTQPITQLTQVSNVLQQMAAAAERIFEFLDAPEEEPDHATARTADVECNVP